jgi:hypothetical protein
MRLFHFSEDGGIEIFNPRSVRIPSERPAGREWLNGPLVWAIGEPHQAMYLFPRECPRVVLWQTPETTAEDRAAWWGEESPRMIACIEWAWFERIRDNRLYRYELPSSSFEDLNDAGMWISRTPVVPLRVDLIEDVLGTLSDLDVELRLMPILTPLQNVWATTLHASGIRLRNAKNCSRRPMSNPA